MNNLVDIVEKIIKDINLQLPVTEIVGDKYFMCNTLFLTKLKEVTDSAGNKFTVTSFELNTWVILEPKGHVLPFEGLIINTNEITFLHGDPKSVNSEYLQKGKRTENKTPFIWLVESYTFEDLPRDSAVKDAFNVRLFFMDWANTDKWVNDEHNDNVVKPMHNLEKTFKNVIENDLNFRGLDTCNVTVRTRFGEIKIGGRELIIEESLSGVEMNFKLEVYSSDCCGNNNAPVNTCVPAIVKNTDLTYLTTVESGGFLELPDIINIDSDGTPTPTPAQTPFICSQGTGAPVTSTFNGASISSTPSGGNKDIVVKDTNGVNKGVKVTDTATDLIIEVDAVVSLPISYVRDNSNRGVAQYQVYDLKWYILNTTRFTYTVNGIQPVLDPTDETKLLTINHFGNYLLGTNSLGGTVYDGSDGSIPRYIIHHILGKGFHMDLPLTAPATWPSTAFEIQTFTDKGFSDWNMLTIFDVDILRTGDGSTNFLIDNGATFPSIYVYTLNVNSFTQNRFWSYARTFQETYIFPNNNTNVNINRQAVICRNHF